MSRAARLVPRSRWGVVLAVLWALLLLFPVLSADLFFQNMIILSLIFAIGASGLNIISGYGGYVSLGQSAFLGLGAYTVGLLAVRVDVSPFVFVPLAGVVGAAFAALLGVIAMRTRGHSFVILTIAFLLLMQLVLLNWPSFTKGSSGLSLPLAIWDPAYQNWPFYYALVALLALAVLLSWRIRRTKLGMGLVAMREDEDKAATVGISTPTYKILGFVASAVVLSMAGGVYAYYLNFIDPRGMFDIVISVQIILSVLLGGRGTLWGPVLGAFIIEPLNEFANQSLGGGNSRLLIFGGLMALVVLFMPQGIVPAAGAWLEGRRRRGEDAVVGARLGAPLVMRERDEAPGGHAAAAGRTLLEVNGLERRFGGVRAVDGCSFAVPAGSITALIGPNGSGKTTVFNLIDGMMRPSAGEVRFDGQRIDGLRPWRRAHLGIGRTFQITRLFGDMTVLENVVVPLRSFAWGRLNADAVSGPEAARAEELLEFVGMRRYRDQKAKALSYGQQKLVELAQVLMLDPKLILLDEPAGGINPTAIERMGEMIRTLNRQGMTFLIVEHNMPFVLGLCDPVRVLARGTCICEGGPEVVQHDPRVLDAYLGEDFVLEEVGA
ncbi:MAG: branched-chain amino acid transport system ATP-binding protein livM [Solirubrobacteraceae bacterium]|jgi:branched-chain amino acid transport system permease protein|nr:branched-chain amino acid transport system ATP-binding protein livM [Solirubrobacteraceae bacterium]